MTLEAIRRICLTLPHVTEDVKWENELAFCVGEKMFALTGLEEFHLSFKASPEEFAELVEREGLRPAPYLARAQWVTIEDPKALRPEEVRRLLEESYRLIWARLPKKLRLRLEAGGDPPDAV